MSDVSAPIVAPGSFQIEILEGWSGTEHPRAGVAFEVVADDVPDGGVESRLSFEVVDRLPQGQDGAGPMETVLGERVDLLRETMTDALFLDMALHGPRPAEGQLPAFRATVAYRHGPHLVTALLWALPVGDGALLITGLTDDDLIVADALDFLAMVRSLRFGTAIDPIAAAAARELEAVDGESLEPPGVALPPAPEGWIDEDRDDTSLLRRLVSVVGDEVPAVITVMQGLDVAGDAAAHHIAALESLDATMTDPELQNAGIDTIAIGTMHRSLVVFRQGTGARVADLWTGTPQSGAPIILVVSDFDDEAGRERAEAWVQAASLTELGVA